MNVLRFGVGKGLTVELICVHKSKENLASLGSMECGSRTRSRSQGKVSSFRKPLQVEIQLWLFLWTVEKESLKKKKIHNISKTSESEMRP